MQLAQSDVLQALLLFKVCDNEFYYDPSVIRESLQYVIEDTLMDSLAIINDLQDEWTKQIALSELAVVALNYELNTAIEITNLCDTHYKPRTLETISFKMLKTDIGSAKQIAESIDHFPSKIGALASIASHMHDEEAIDELLAIVEVKERFDADCKEDEVFSSIAYSIEENFPEIAMKLRKDHKIDDSNDIVYVVKR